MFSGDDNELRIRARGIVRGRTRRYLNRFLNGPVFEYAQWDLRDALRSAKKKKKLFSFEYVWTPRMCVVEPVGIVRLTATRTHDAEERKLRTLEGKSNWAFSDPGDLVVNTVEEPSASGKRP